MLGAFGSIRGQTNTSMQDEEITCSKEQVEAFLAASGQIDVQFFNRRNVEDNLPVFTEAPLQQDHVYTTKLTRVRTNPPLSLVRCSSPLCSLCVRPCATVTKASGS